MSAMAVPQHGGILKLWKQALGNRTFLLETLITLVLTIVTFRLCSYVLVHLEARTGARLDDPILRLVGPFRLTWVTFAILWVSVFSSIYLMLNSPRMLVVGFQAAVLILAFRTITIYLVPLRPLSTIIPLADPVITNLGPGKIIVKDLLFSGHTSIMFLLFLAAEKKWLRVLYLLGTLAVATCVLLQHVHYSGDVFIAPFFAYTSWRMANWVHNRLDNSHAPGTGCAA